MELFLLKSILLIDTAALEATFIDAFRQADPRSHVPDGLDDLVLGLGGLIKDVLRGPKVVWSPAIGGDRRSEFTLGAVIVGGRVFGRVAEAYQYRDFESTDVLGHSLGTADGFEAALRVRFPITLGKNDEVTPQLQLGLGHDRNVALSREWTASETSSDVEHSRQFLGELDVQFAVSVVLREDRPILPAVEVGRGMSGSDTMTATLSIGEDSAVEVGLVTNNAPDDDAGTGELAPDGPSEAAQPEWVEAIEAAISTGVVWQRLPLLQPFIDEILASIGRSFPDLVSLVEPGLQNWATEPATVALVQQLLRERTKPGQSPRPRTIVRVATPPGLVNRQLTIEVTGRLSGPRPAGSANPVHRSSRGLGSSDTRTAATSLADYTKAEVWTWQVHDFTSPHTSIVNGTGSWSVKAGDVAGESQTKQRKSSVEWIARPVNVAYTLELAATVWIDSALSPVLDLMTAGVAQNRVRLDVPATKSEGGFFTVDGDVVIGLDADRVGGQLDTVGMEPGEVTATTTRTTTTADPQPQRSGYTFDEEDFHLGEVQPLWFNGLGDLLAAASDAFFSEDLSRTTTAAFTSPQGLKDSLSFLLDQKHLGANFPDLVLNAITRAVVLPTWTLTDALGTLTISLDVTTIHPLGQPAPNLTYRGHSSQGTSTAMGTQNANETQLNLWGLVDSQAAGNIVAPSPFVDSLRSQNRENVAGSSSSSEHGIKRTVELQDVEAGLTWWLAWAPGDGAAPTLLEVRVPTGNRLRMTPKLLARLLDKGVRDSDTPFSIAPSDDNEGEPDEAIEIITTADNGVDKEPPHDDLQLSVTTTPGAEVPVAEVPAASTGLAPPAQHSKTEAEALDLTGLGATPAISTTDDSANSDSSIDALQLLESSLDGPQRAPVVSPSTLKHAAFEVWATSGVEGLSRVGVEPGGTAWRLPGGSVLEFVESGFLLRPGTLMGQPVGLDWVRGLGWGVAGDGGEWVADVVRLSVGAPGLELSEDVWGDAEWLLTQLAAAPAGSSDVLGGGWLRMYSRSDQPLWWSPGMRTAMDALALSQLNPGRPAGRLLGGNPKNPSTTGQPESDAVVGAPWGTVGWTQNQLVWRPVRLGTRTERTYLVLPPAGLAGFDPSLHWLGLHETRPTVASDERLVEMVVQHRYRALRSGPWAVDVAATLRAVRVGPPPWVTSSGVDLVVPPGRNNKLYVSSISAPGGAPVVRQLHATDTPFWVLLDDSDEGAYEPGTGEHGTLSTVESDVEAAQSNPVTDEPVVPEWTGWSEATFAARLQAEVQRRVVNQPVLVRKLEQPGPDVWGFGRDYFGRRVASRPKPHLQDYPYDRLRVNQFASFLRSLSLTIARPDPEAFKAMLQPEALGDDRVLEGPVPTVRGKILVEPRYVTPGNTVETPLIRHVVWVGPLGEHGKQGEFRRQVAEAAKRLAKFGFATVLWRNAPREVTEAALRGATGVMDGWDLAAVASEVAWALKNQISLVPYDEIYNDGNEMTTQAEVATGVARRTGEGFAGASDNVRPVIMDDWGGLYADGDVEVGPRVMEDIQATLTSKYGFTLHLHREGVRSRVENTVAIGPPGHAIARGDQSEFKRLHALDQPSVLSDMHQGRRVWRRPSVVSRAAMGKALGGDRWDLYAVKHLTHKPDGAWRDEEVGRRPRGIPSWEQIVTIATDVIHSLVRRMHVRFGDLQLTDVMRVLQDLPHPQAVWRVVIGFIARTDELRLLVRTVTMHRIGDDPGSVASVDLPDDVLALLSTQFQHGQFWQRDRFLPSWVNGLTAKPDWLNGEYVIPVTLHHPDAGFTHQDHNGRSLLRTPPPAPPPWLVRDVPGLTARPDGTGWRLASGWLVDFVDQRAVVVRAPNGPSSPVPIRPNRNQLRVEPNSEHSPLTASVMAEVKAIIGALGDQFVQPSGDQTSEGMALDIFADSVPAKRGAADILRAYPQITLGGKLTPEMVAPYRGWFPAVPTGWDRHATRNRNHEQVLKDEVDRRLPFDLLTVETDGGHDIEQLVWAVQQLPPADPGAFDELVAYAPVWLEMAQLPQYENLAASGAVITTPMLLQFDLEDPDRVNTLRLMRRHNARVVFTPLSTGSAIRDAHDVLRDFVLPPGVDVRVTKVNIDEDSGVPTLYLEEAGSTPTGPMTSLLPATPQENPDAPGARLTALTVSQHTDAQQAPPGRAAIEESVEILWRPDGRPVAWLRAGDGDPDELARDRDLALIAAVPSGFDVVVFAAGRGGQLFGGEQPVQPIDLADVLRRKLDAAGHQGGPVYFATCEIATGSFARQFAERWQANAAGWTRVTWIDPQTGATASSGPIVVNGVLGPNLAAPDGELHEFAPDGDGAPVTTQSGLLLTPGTDPASLWVGPGRVWVHKHVSDEERGEGSSRRPGAPMAWGPPQQIWQVVDLAQGVRGGLRPAQAVTGAASAWLVRQPTSGGDRAWHGMNGLTQLLRHYVPSRFADLTTEAFVAMLRAKATIARTQVMIDLDRNVAPDLSDPEFLTELTAEFGVRVQLALLRPGPQQPARYVEQPMHGTRGPLLLLHHLSGENSAPHYEWLKIEDADIRRMLGYDEGALPAVGAWGATKPACSPSSTTCARGTRRCSAVSAAAVAVAGLLRTQRRTPAGGHPGHRSPVGLIPRAARPGLG